MRLGNRQRADLGADRRVDVGHRRDAVEQGAHIKAGAANQIGSDPAATLSSIAARASAAQRAAE